MKCKLSVIVLVAAAAVFSLNSGAEAQLIKKIINNRTVDGESTDGQSRMYIQPGSGGSNYDPRPRLGFHGHMIHGYGMRVDHAHVGTPASQAGLEGGDVIWRIDGRRILSRFDYDNALRNAAMYQGGWLTLTVRNVRYDMGMSYQKFVNVSVRVMGGYAVPVAGATAGLPGGNQPTGYLSSQGETKSGAGAGEVGSDSTASGDF